MYKACIFDLDGTLTDTLESLTYSVNATLRELDLPAITSEQCKSFVGSGARFLIERALQAAMERLGERERYIIELRFFEGKTQIEVAEQIHISQAQVSRLEKNALKNMRTYLT